MNMFDQYSTLSEAKKTKEKEKPESEEQKVSMRPRAASELGIISKEEAERLEREGYSIIISEKDYVNLSREARPKPKIKTSEIKNINIKKEENIKRTEHVGGTLQISPRFVDSDRYGSVTFRKTNEGLLQGFSQKGYYEYDVSVIPQHEREKKEAETLKRISKEIGISAEDAAKIEKTTFQPVIEHVEKTAPKDPFGQFGKGVVLGGVGVLSTVEQFTKPEFYKYVPKTLPYLPYFTVKYGEGVIEYMREQPIQFAGELVGSSAVFSSVSKGTSFIGKVKQTEPIMIETKLREKTTNIPKNLKATVYDYVSEYKNQKVVGELIKIENEKVISYFKEKFAIPESEKISSVNILHKPKLVTENNVLGVRRVSVKELEPKIFLSQEIGETKFFKEIGTIEKGKLEFSSVSYVTKQEYAGIHARREYMGRIRIKYEKMDEYGKAIIRPKGEAEIRISDALSEIEKRKVLEHEITHIARPDLSESRVMDGGIEIRGIKEINLAKTQKISLERSYPFMSRPVKIGKNEVIQSGEILTSLHKEIEIKKTIIKYYGIESRLEPEIKISQSVTIPPMYDFFKVSQPEIRVYFAPILSQKSETSLKQKYEPIISQMQTQKSVQIQKTDSISITKQEISQIQLQKTTSQIEQKLDIMPSQIRLEVMPIRNKIFPPYMFPIPRTKKDIKIPSPEKIRFGGKRLYKPSLFSISFGISTKTLTPIKIATIRPKVKL